jgi:hypothetical protein
VGVEATQAVVVVEVMERPRHTQTLGLTPVGSDVFEGGSNIMRRGGRMDGVEAEVLLDIAAGVAIGRKNGLKSGVQRGERLQVGVEWRWMLERAGEKIDGHRAIALRTPSQTSSPPTQKYHPRPFDP